MVLGALLTALVMQLLSFPALETMQIFFVDPIADGFGRRQLLIVAAPLFLCALGLSAAFRGGVQNIGADGQLMCGALCAGGLALSHPHLGSFLLPACLVAAAAGGALWAAIAAALRVWFGASELLSSLFLVYVAQLILTALVSGPWREPGGYGMETSPLPDNVLLPTWGGVHAGVWALAILGLVWWFLERHLMVFFRLKVLGDAPQAARYAGYRSGALIWIAMLLSGGLAGLAGYLQIAGPLGRLNPDLSSGYGFAAIAVAFAGRLNCLGMALTSLLVALLRLGAENAQIGLHLPQSVGLLFQGVFLVSFLLCQRWIPILVDRMTMVAAKRSAHGD
jgi:simple sugar transport system permease protein